VPAGLARGLGRAISLALAHAGADVALGLRDAHTGGGLSREIEGMGRRAFRFQMDAHPEPERALRRQPGAIRCWSMGVGRRGRWGRPPGLPRLLARRLRSMSSSSDAM